MLKGDIVSSFCVLGCLLHVMQPDSALSELGLKSRSSHGRSLGCYSHISGYVRGMFHAWDNSAIDQFIRGKRISIHMQQKLVR